MKRPIFAGNWKMHLGPTEARDFMAAFLARYTPREDRTVALFPPAISFTAAATARGHRTDVSLGIQNVWTEDTGAFTGETSAPMARSAGASLVLVGHSERRHVFGETDQQSAAKCAAVLRNDMTPVLCVGEKLDEREAGNTEAVVLRQLRAALDVLGHDAARLWIAYEPVWAIGTGRNATPDDAAAVHRAIRAELHARLGNDAAKVPILYGGSVNKANVAALLAAEGVDGVLVGGASLDPEGWAAICQA